MEKLKLTREGLKKLEKELELKKQELRELGKYKNEAASNEGDAWHDNFAFEQTEIKERALICQINDLQEKISNAEIIETVKTTDEDEVGINSKVRVKLKYSDGLEEKLFFTVTGDFGTSGSGQVSINSPIGKCIMGQKVGFKGKYPVLNKDIEVEILEVNN